MFVLCVLAEAEKFLNGKLSDNTAYAVFQRTFATDGYYENEGFTTFTTDKDHTGTIIAVVVVLVVLVAAIAAGIFFYRRRQSRRDENGEDEEMQPVNRPHRRRTGSKLFRRSGIGKLT